MDHEEIAIAKVKRIIAFRKRNTHPRRTLPSVYSTSYIERSLAYSLKGLKRGLRCQCPGTSKFYPSLQEVAEKAGDAKLFDRIDRKQKAIDKLKKVIDWTELNGRLPGRTVKDPYENSLYIIIQNLGYIKDGSLQGVWYKELDEMMIAAGHPRLFWRAFDGQPVSSDVSDVLNFYKKFKRLPSQLSEDADERRLYRKLIRYRQVLQGKTSMTWNPEIDEMIKARKIKNIFRVCK